MSTAVRVRKGACSVIDGPHVVFTSLPLACS